MEPGAITVYRDYEVISSRRDDDMATAVLGRLVLQYVTERTQRGEFTGSTPKTIRKNLWLFAEFVGPDKQISRVTKRRVEQWLEAMNVSSTTKRHRLSYVRSFGVWLVERGYTRRNPAAGIKGPRQPRLLPPRALNVEQVRAIFDACGDTRDELITSLMAQEGLRRMEVAGLQLGDIDMSHRAMHIVGKGGHERALWVTEETLLLLKRYLADDHPGTAGPLIRSQRDPNKGITAERVALLVKRRMVEAGVVESPHSLRHTALSDMLEHGAHVRTVQTVAGHASMKVTERYLRRMVGDLETAMDGRTYRKGI